MDCDRRGTDGLWNNKCATDRSIGFVSASMSIYPLDLIHKLKGHNKGKIKNHQKNAKYAYAEIRVDKQGIKRLIDIY